MALRYLDLERSVPHALDYGSIDGDHIFFWNGAYLLFERGKGVGLAALSLVQNLLDRAAINAMLEFPCTNVLMKTAAPLFRS